MFENILQPPFAEKFSLLVDDIGDNENFGIATDLKKIQYNLYQINEDYNVDLQIRQCLVDEGITDILNFGRFIIILQIRKDLKKGQMTFFDFDIDIPLEEILDTLRKNYSVNIVEAWVKNYEILRNEFTSKKDLVKLVKV